MNVTLDLHVHPDATTARLTFDLDRVGEREHVGVAKRHPDDRHNEGIAIRLAVGRAFQHAADELLSEADSYIGNVSWLSGVDLARLKTVADDMLARYWRKTL